MLQSRIFCKYAIWSLLGTGMAGMMILPCADAFITSSKLGLHTGLNGNVGRGIFPQGHFQPFYNLAAYPFQIFPSILGRCNSLDSLKVFRSDLFYIAYFGSLPVLISFLAPFRKEAPLLARLLIIIGLVLPLTPLVRFLYQRLYLLSIFGGILAFAHFMEDAPRKTRIKIFNLVGLFTIACMVIWFAISLFLTFEPLPLDILRQKLLFEGKGSTFGYFSSWMTNRVDYFIGDLFIWSSQQLWPLILFILALFGLRATASPNVIKGNLGRWIVAAVVIIEVTLFASRWVVFTDLNAYPLFPITSEVTALRKFVGRQGRVTTLIHPDSHMALTPFIPNTLGPYGIATISGYDSIIPNGMILPQESAGDGVKLGRFGVTHLITYPANHDVGNDWSLIWKSPSMALYENRHFVPRYIGFSSDSEKDIFMRGSTQGGWLSLKEGTDLENTREIDTVQGLRWIRIAENQALGWQYRTGEALPTDWRPVLRAPDGSMLLDLGNSNNNVGSVVHMRYNPPLRFIGFVTSGTFSILTLATAFLIRRHRNYFPFLT
jgi:hypothetical protein